MKEATTTSMNNVGDQTVPTAELSSNISWRTGWFDVALVERPEGATAAQTAMATDQCGNGAAYGYSTLENTDIRVLEILSSTAGASPLLCNIEHKPLAEARARRYTALSYTWGCDTAREFIFLNGQTLAIQSNLAHILRTMRSLNYKFVWVCSGPQALPSTIVASDGADSNNWSRLTQSAQTKPTIKSAVLRFCVCEEYTPVLYLF